jgi:hypothetical protein
VKNCAKNRRYTRCGFETRPDTTEKQSRVGTQTVESAVARSTGFMTQFFTGQECSRKIRFHQSSTFTSMSLLVSSVHCIREMRKHSLHLPVRDTVPPLWNGAGIGSSISSIRRMVIDSLHEVHTIPRMTRFADSSIPLEIRTRIRAAWTASRDVHSSGERSCGHRDRGTCLDDCDGVENDNRENRLCYPVLFAEKIC